MGIEIATAAVLLASSPAAHGHPVTQGGMVFGRAVLVLTDLDGDGINEFAVGAPSATVADRPKAGMVLVFSGRTQQRLARWASDDAFGFGHSLRRLDDINGDGAPEVLVGRPGIGPVDVRCGRTGSLLFLVDAAARDVVQVGDVDGDAASDFLITGTRPLALRSGKSGEALGASIAKRTVAAFLPVGDIDGDGIVDGVVPDTQELLLSGQGSADPEELYGRTYERKLLDRTGAVLSAEGARLQGAIGLGAQGEEGVTELFVATCKANGEGTQLHAVSLGAAVEVRWTVPGPGRNNPGRDAEFSGYAGQLDTIGASIGLAPDVDGDGLQDLWVSEPSQTMEASFAVFSSSTGKVAYQSRWSSMGYDSGLMMDIAQDVDGDGVQDLLIGAARWAERGWLPDRGTVRMVSGKTGALLWILKEAGLQEAETYLERTAWENRLLVMHGPKALCETQVQLLANDYHGAIDRDILAIDLNGEASKARIGDLPARPLSATLRHLYGIEGDEFVMLLIGKDGGTKKRYDQPVEAKEIWKVIDVMPMRRQESKNR